MDKFDFNTATGPQEKETRHTRQGHGPCEVYGCPRDGHIYTSGWNCRYHHGKSGSSLARITMMLRNHEREFNWYEHVLNATVTDFGMGGIAREAPSNLQVLPSETLQEYKARMTKHIENLLRFVEPARMEVADE